MSMRGLNLTMEVVSQAAAEVAHIIKALAHEGVLEGFKGYLVVMDPNCPFEEVTFDEAILYQRPFRNGVDEWEYDYETIALAKAKESWETGLSSRELMALQPLLVYDEDAPWAGSIVVKFPNGQMLVIAFSGYASEDDEWIDWMLESRLWALGYKRIPEDSLVGGRKVAA